MAQVALLVQQTSNLGGTEAEGDPADAMAFIERIDDVSQRHGAKGITAVFSVGVPDELVFRLLERPDTVSVVLAEETDFASNRDHQRIGWLRPDGRVGKAPGAVGDLVLTFGPPDAFGFELVRLSLRLGGRRVAHDMLFGFAEPSSLWSLLVSRWWRGANRALQRTLRKTLLSGKFGSLDPFLARTHRRLSRWLAMVGERKPLMRLARQLHETPVAGNSIKNRWMFVTGSLGPGGAERQLVNTLQGLVKRGASDLHLLAERLSPAPYDFYLSELECTEGLCISELGRDTAIDRADVLAFAKFAEDMPADFRKDILELFLTFRRLRPEVVHAWQDGPSVKAGVAAVLAGVDRIVIGWRTLSPLTSGLYHPCYERILRALAARDNVVLINNSAAGAHSYADWLRVDRKTIQVIRNGVDFSALEKPRSDALCAFRQSLDVPAAAPVLGTVFRFGDEKRPMLWLQTAAKVALRLPDVHFLMIGDGTLHEQVKAAAKAWDLEGRVHLPGRTTTPALALAAMDLFLLTSVYEGLPNVLIEAAALGVPVISTDVGGVRETLIHGETGFAVASSRPGTLADKVVELLVDEGWRDQARLLSPGWVRQRFAMDRMIDETLAAYGVIIGSGKDADRRLQLSV